MNDNTDIRKGVGFGYWHKKMICMIRCFQCGKENYHGMVSKGICVWCGHDANKKEDKDNGKD